MLSILCRCYLDLIKKKYGIHSELLFPSADPEKPLQVASINKKFHDFWNRTRFSINHTKEPTVHSLRYSFVVIRMNKWMEQGIEPNGMMPYLSKYLGHASVDDMFYYYHQIESAFKIIRSKDSVSTIIIPEQSVKSKNTITTYRDGLTVFRRYVADTIKMSIGTFKFADCTHDVLLEYIAFLNDSGCAETTCNNRLASIRAYLWYVADGDVSMQPNGTGSIKGSCPTRDKKR